MNLLLYNESKRALSPRSTRPSSGLPLWHGDEPQSLPDSLLAELGYSSSPPTETNAETDPDETFTGLFRLFVAPALSF